MCGIVGFLGADAVAERLYESLRRMEYRGYDSAGIATLDSGRIARVRAEGKLDCLGERLAKTPLGGQSGIGHTRWATHGSATERNAHPIASTRTALVHNGIIENHKALRESLQARGCIFETDTDTEVVVRLVDLALESGLEPTQAVASVLGQLEGAFALAFLFAGEEDLLIGARRGSPLAAGRGAGTAALGSDVLALSPLAQEIAYLEEGDLAVVRRGAVSFWNTAGEEVSRPWKRVSLSNLQISKDGHRHFMEKEIHEQPTVVGETLQSYLHPARLEPAFPDLPMEWSTLKSVVYSACGSAYYAAFVGKYWMESLASLPVMLEIASELRYREAALSDCGLGVSISQSGETMDTLEAARLMSRLGIPSLAIVNQSESTLARESDVSLLTRAGPEIGVASTKAFTTQLVVLATLALQAAHARHATNATHITADTLRAHASALLELPSRLAEVLSLDAPVRAIAADLAEARHALYLARGNLYPIAMEGALKLKEISYIHAEGYAGGEMKHGPLALVDKSMPVIVLAPSGPLFSKIASNAAEVLARGGRVCLLSDAEGLAAFGDGATWSLELPKVSAFVQPILYTLPIQLLAYHTACVRGTDLDRPRNLAKSVTVE